MTKIMNNDTIWAEYKTGDISTLKRIGVLQYYPPNTRFENNDSWKWAPMLMIFGIKQQYLRQKERLLVRGHVVESSEHTIY